MFFHTIDPVCCHIFGFDIYWYGLSYVVGILLGSLYLSKQHIHHPLMATMTKKKLDDLIVWLVVAIIVGGRLGHILFYDFHYFIKNPLTLFMTRQGGMSFHGGLIGVILCITLFCQKHKWPLLAFGDLLAPAACIGIGIGRIANFINSELYGRVTNVPWSVIFPRIDLSPRHPTQLYEAFLEGFVLFLLTHYAYKLPYFKNVPGRTSGLFLLGYGCFRSLVEHFKIPDGYASFLGITATLGQWLSFPLVLIGLFFIFKNTLPCKVSKLSS